MVRPIVLFLLLVALVSASYSRFGSNKVAKQEETHPSINDQIMQGSHIRYYGRFRDGSDDVLNRYFNRL
uniref:Secreted protein n=1 Tax=Caenorhabditis tropicalis TaxID=1561998 RepID=A0A1I7UFX6_9PELO